mgnify:CR=1 FL=1
MKEEKLFEALADLSDFYILEAHEENKKKNTWLKWGILAACLCMLVILPVVHVFRDSGTVVYAEEFSKGDLLVFDENEKITISSSILELRKNRPVRLAICLRDYEEAYPDYGFSWEEETTWEDYLQFEAYVKEQEVVFLAEIGAYDISDTEYNTLICTMKKDDIEKMNQGKCSYTVVMYTADDGDIKQLSIEAFNGDYHCKELTAVPLISSFMPPDDYVKTGHLILKDGKASISFSCGLDPAFYNISYEYLDCVEASNEAMGDLLDMLLHGNHLSYAELRYAHRKSYELCDASGTCICKLYLTNEAIYLDLGMQGIYRF